MTTQNCNAVLRLRKAGMKDAEIAREIGATRPAVNLWANGKRTPSSRYIGPLVKLAESKGITLLAADLVPPEGL